MSVRKIQPDALLDLLVILGAIREDTTYLHACRRACAARESSRPTGLRPPGGTQPPPYARSTWNLILVLRRLRVKSAWELYVINAMHHAENLGRRP